MIHELSDVKTKNIGSDTLIWQYVVILAGARIGKNCNINCHCFIENDVFVGDNVTVKSGVYLWDGIEAQNNVFIGPNDTFVNDLYPRSKQYPSKFQGCKIEEGASIGANATILSGLTIGQYSLIGAGSVVVKDISPFSVWVGNPAKQIGYITKEGKRLNNDLKDEKANKRYEFDEDNNLIAVS
ncbi:acyltransferase [Marivirga tractuosa]|uniref:acyltransferase n=1 Tax=Marivirga tractuosa TaxID=1006 RepID=UPI0035CE9EE4